MDCGLFMEECSTDQNQNTCSTSRRGITTAITISTILLYWLEPEQSFKTISSFIFSRVNWSAGVYGTAQDGWSLTIGFLQLSKTVTTEHILN